jgi:hypothetical protein
VLLLLLLVLFPLSQALLLQEVLNIDALDGLLSTSLAAPHSEPCCCCCCCFDVFLQALLKQEVLNIDAVEGLLGKRPFTSTTMQNIDRYRWVGMRLCGNITHQTL